MAIIVSTITNFPLNDSDREFNITFDYLARRFVKVAIVGGETRQELVLGIDYRFVTKTRIRTTIPLGSPWSRIEIRRETSSTDRIVNFSDGSVLRAKDLNASQIQAIHIAEEARDLSTLSISEDEVGQLDAKDRPIVNVGEPSNDSDAATKGYVDNSNSKTLRLPFDVPPILGDVAGRLVSFDSNNRPVAVIPAITSEVALAALLKSDGGAREVGTLSGMSVQEDLDSISLNLHSLWKELLSNVGVNLVDGSFKVGARILEPTDALWFSSEGRCYQYVGSDGLPLDVAKDSIPDSNWRVIGSNLLDRVLMDIECHSSKFQTLLEWAAYPAKRKVLDGGTYTINDTLYVTCTSLMTDGVVTLNVTSNTVGMYFGTSGRTLLTTLTSSILEGTSSIVTDTSNIKVGDLLCFFDPRDYSWSGYRPYYRSGEFVEVTHVSGDTVYFAGGLLHGYSVGVQLYKVDTVRVDISGEYNINLPEYNAKSMGMMLEQVRDSKLDNLIIHTYRAPYALQLKRCMNLSGSPMRLTQRSNRVDLALDYACYVVNCQSINLFGEYSSERHAVTTTGNGESCSIVNRFINVNLGKGGRMLTTGLGGVAAADWHGNSEYCQYGGYMQGLVCGGGNNSAAGAIIDPIPDRKVWPTILASEVRTLNFDLSGTTIKGVVDPSSINRGCVDFGGNSNAFANMTIEGGIINLSNSNIKTPALRAIEIRNRGSMVEHIVNLNGAVINSPSGSHSIRIAPLANPSPEPLEVWTSPTNVLMEGFVCKPGSIIQLNNELSTIHGLRMKGRGTVTLATGSTSSELVINYPITMPGAPRFVGATRTGSIATTAPKVIFLERDSNTTRTRISVNLVQSEPLTSPLDVNINWVLIW